MLAIKQLLEFQPDADFELEIPEIKTDITITIRDKIEAYKNALAWSWATYFQPPIKTEEPSTYREVTFEEISP